MGCYNENENLSDELLLAFKEKFPNYDFDIEFWFAGIENNKLVVSIYIYAETEKELDFSDKLTK